MTVNLIQGYLEWVNSEHFELPNMIIESNS